MGGGDPNFNLGPPLMKLLGRPIVGLRGHDNFLCRKGTCGADVGLVGEELGEGLPEVLLVLNELLDGSFPFHFRHVRGGAGAGLLETREPKSVTAGIRRRGRWDVIWDRGDERELEVKVVEDLVVDGSMPVRCSSSSWVFRARNLSRSATSSSWRKGRSRMSAIL